MIEHYVVPILSPLWWMGLIFSSLFIAIPIVWARNKSELFQDKLGFYLGLFFILLSFSVHPYMLINGTWNIKSSLPLQLCGISAWLSGIVFFTRSQVLFECLLFWGLAGAIHSILTPEMSLGNDNYTIFEYYASHAGIILSGLYLTVVKNRKPRKNSWFRIFILTQLVILVVGLINQAMGANYMYLCKKPMVDNPFIMGDWPIYLGVLQLVALLHFFVIYLVFQWAGKIQPITSDIDSPNP